jgi:hypothetical protein
MSGEVLRRDARPREPQQPERKRPLGDDSDTSEPRFGCPMLTRTRLGIPFRGGQHVPRCSMGWTVHNEDEAWLCMHVPTRNECWKEHPDVLAKLLEELDPDAVDSAAD